MATPAVPGLVAPGPEPFIARILCVVVPCHHDRFRADEVIAPEEGGTALRLIKEQPAHRGDLLCAPQLVRVDLPEETRPVESAERRAHHLPLAVPELAGGLPVERNALRFRGGDVIEICAGAVDGATAVVTRLFDAAPTPGAPPGVMGKLSDALHDVPMPFERQVAEHLE